MPTLPSTYSSSYHTDGLASACIVATPDDALSGGPTPDPDLDELVLVSVVTGDGVGAITHVRTRTRTRARYLYCRSD